MLTLPFRSAISAVKKSIREKLSCGDAQFYTCIGIHGTSSNKEQKLKIY